MGRSSDMDDEEATNSEFNRDRSGSGDYTAGKFPPMDKYKLVYIIFFISGVGTLLPWNFFITAIPYFQYKLRNQSLDSDSYLDPKNMTKEQRLFGSYLAVCSMVPLATFNIIGLVIMKWISSFARYVIGSSLVFLMFLLTTILVKINISAEAFLGVTLASVVVINAGCALLQGGVFGLASMLPPQHMKGCLEGQAIAGVLAALASLATLAASPHPTTSALAYFIFALFVLGVSVVLTLTLRNNKYFLYYQNTQYECKSGDNEPSFDTKSSQQDSAGHTITSDTVEIRHGLTILQSIGDVWIPGLCVFLTLMITLSLFPALLQPVVSMNFDPSDRWTSTFFTPVTVFLSYNLCDWIGRSLAGLVKWPRRSQYWLLMAICFLRSLIIPFSLFLNQQPRTRLPVVFHHDAFPILVVIFLGLSNGYLMTLAMMYGPSFARPGGGEGAGVALSIYIALGLAVGVAVSAGLAQAI